MLLISHHQISCNGYGPASHWPLGHLPCACFACDGLFKVAWPDWAVLTAASISSWSTITLPGQHFQSSTLLVGTFHGWPLLRSSGFPCWPSCRVVNIPPSVISWHVRSISYPPSHCWRQCEMEWPCCGFWSEMDLLYITPLSYKWLLLAVKVPLLLHIPSLLCCLDISFHSRLTHWVWHMLCILLLYPHGASECLQQFLIVAWLFVAAIQAVLWHCLVIVVPCCLWMW